MSEKQLKHKVGDKFLVEITETRTNGTCFYPYNINNSFWVGDEFFDGLTASDSPEDAWKFAWDLFNNHPVSEIENVFMCNFKEIPSNYSYADAKKRWDEHEKSKKIRIGDEILLLTNDKKYIVYGFTEDRMCKLTNGSANLSCPESEVKKTGRRIHFANCIAEFLQNATVSE